MSEIFYRAVRLTGRMILRASTSPKILHADRARRPGAMAAMSRRDASPARSPAM